MSPGLSKPPTPTDYGIIAVGASVLLILLGITGFGFGFFTPPQKPEVAAGFKLLSAWSVGIGCFISLTYWLVRRFTE